MPCIEIRNKSLRCQLPPSRGECLVHGISGSSCHIHTRVAAFAPRSPTSRSDGRGWPRRRRERKGGGWGNGNIAVRRPLTMNTL